MSRQKLTADEAISMLPEGDEVHTVVNSVPGVMLGCDWQRDNVIEAIRNHECELAGDMARRMNHGLVVWTREERPLFVATREDFDYGVYDMPEEEGV
jgi:hypothetical protein